MSRAQLEVQGKKLWRVDVTQERHVTMYVLADTHDQAQEDAQELAEGMHDGEWSTAELDWGCDAAYTEPSPDAFVWTGGPLGHDETWGALSGAKVSGDG